MYRIRRQTRRTETSQYPEEKKSTEILRVAASESGGAVRDSEMARRMSWEAQSKRVIIPYPKAMLWY